MEVCDCFEVGDRIIIEGYSPKINGYVLANNRRVNMQIVSMVT